MQVGITATSYASFELTVHCCIWALAGVDETTGECMTSEIMSYGPKFRIIIALMHHRGFGKKYISKTNKLFEQVVAILKECNKYVHGICAWTGKGGDPVLVTRYATNSGILKNDLTPYSSDDMQILIEKI